MNYTETMTDAVAKAHIPLKYTGEGKFLCDNGYTGRSITSKADKIIDRAKVIQARMEKL